MHGSAAAQCAWDLLVNPWHLDEQIEGFPVPAGAFTLPGPADPAASELDRLTGRCRGAADAVARADRPLVLAGDCLTAVGVVAGLQRQHRDLSVIWLDAHGDFNTPETTRSGYLGGMPLAAACGLWDGGYGAGLDPRRVVMSDARDLDTDERELLDRAGVRRVAPGAVADAVRGERVFLHLDLDILDPAVMAAAVPAPGGLALEALASLLRDLGAAADVIGIEVTAFDDPAPERLAGPLARAIAPACPVGSAPDRS